MHNGLFRGSDEECAELYDVLIKRGALNYSKPDELWYVILSAFAMTLYKLTRV